jgi:hypothetical protein
VLCVSPVDLFLKYRSVDAEYGGEAAGKAPLPADLSEAGESFGSYGGSVVRGEFIG